MTAILQQRLSRAPGSSNCLNNGINDVACNLRGQDPEVIGKDYKKDSKEKKPAVFPEIFIEAE